MTVQTFVPGQEGNNISVTESAAKHLTGKLSEKPDAKGVRISVKPSGCSGFMYVLDYVETPESKDTLINVNDALTLFVDTESLPVINGTEIDYVKQGLNASIQFKNPNVTGECGCGESFTVN
ncbi:MAG: iron-sulfur cluster assembly accessory protein [Pseudomonadales bacterium]|nr:iron-sulfur cluster assembly accessory protein [Pseudomonadales bacterium]